jgi:orotate phosphoribosyltransferase
LGHIFLPSTGKHYGEFFQLAKALQHTAHARTLCVGLARILRRSGILHKVGEGKRFTLVAPVDAGIPVAFWVGENLDADRIIWVSKNGDDWRLRPLVKLDENDVVVLVDDSILSGKTIEGVLRFLSAKGAQTVGIAAIVDRRKEKGEFNGIPVYSIIKADGSAYDPDQCPLCKDGKELMTIEMK